MKNRKSIVIIAVLLAGSIGNYFRITGGSNIRTVELLSILAIGALAALFIRELIAMSRK